MRAAGGEVDVFCWGGGGWGRSSGGLGRGLAMRMGRIEMGMVYLSVTEGRGRLGRGGTRWKVWRKC